MYTYDFETLGFCEFPTPLQAVLNLQRELKTDKPLFFKRDDTTMIGLGGNKNRKLEYVMADAKKQGADTIITWAGVQSNHCRQTLAYAVKLGMECHLVLNGQPTAEPQGNLLVFQVFGAHISFEPVEALCEQRCLELVEKLRQEGRHPYFVPIGASIPLGSLGYVDSAREIGEQLALFGLVPDHVYLASGSAGTQAGLLAGAKRYLPGCKVHGVAVSRDEASQQAKVLEQTQDLLDFLHWGDLKLSLEDVIINDRHLGEGYARPTTDGLEAMAKVGRSEAILLDPVYTGKAMAGLMAELPHLEMRQNGAVVFVHTGGWPAVFSFNKEVAAYMQQKSPAS
ncbi:MAG: D-cysteine desulfhydrase family protein [Anaerolineaceae bacterium]|nr:D-cysteine desulfhydrase family protein [Anaerolineaceae bacterium]